MSRKTIAMSLVLVCTIGAVMGAFAMTTFAKADTSSTNTTTDTSSNLAVTSQTTNQDDSNQQFSQGMMMDQGFGGQRMGQGRGMEGTVGMSGFGSNYEVSSEYTTAVNNILSNDSDVATLLSEGYNVTSINPVVKSTIQGDGTITTAATTAIVTLQNGTSGYSIVHVDVANAKVTYIETVTRTVIDKSSS